MNSKVESQYVTQESVKFPSIDERMDDEIYANISEVEVEYATVKEEITFPSVSDENTEDVIYDTIDDCDTEM